MWQRFLIASVGGAAITLAMFYGMSEVAEMFTRRSPALYYRVMDFIPGPAGPRRPALVLPEDPPDRPRIEAPARESIVIEATPEFTVAPGAAAPSLHLEETDAAR